MSRKHKGAKRRGKPKGSGSAPGDQMMLDHLAVHPNHSDKLMDMMDRPDKHQPLS